LIPVKEGEAEEVRQSVIIEGNPKQRGVRDEEEKPDQAHVENVPFKAPFRRKAGELSAKADLID
jgi:hypothetical protein